MDEPLHVRDLGRLAYKPALSLQRTLNQQVIDGEAPPTLLLVEHDPVITVTPRKGVSDHLLASPQLLDRLGIDVQPTDRGGDITYHGPGQLVAYPILRLADFDLNLGRYMRLLEQVVIDAVAAYGVTGRREEGATGVWVDAEATDARRHEGTEGGGGGTEGPGDRGTEGVNSPNLEPQASRLAPRTAKLCAMGVRVRRNTTMHGLALNVDPDLLHFQTIVPCGLAGRPVTSLRLLLGEATPTIDKVKRDLAEQMQRALVMRRAESPR